ncbi:putative serine/threonine-protein kinase WNK11 [Senna tora]|uniref:non-specific serine/threonine protein kinase n=1 Tax=Senna tora TaxID=362788 RepID=A0A834XAK5_9FABA|nr:putative serine/threonine-protein kinase WNK11 [Senna tora]
MISLALSAVSGGRTPEPVGQWTPIKDPNDPHVVEIAKFAVDEYDKRHEANLTLEEVKRGRTQAVADDKDTESFVEVDPTGRYGRYPDLLGSGSAKKVYRAFDQLEGKEVAWNQICLKRFINEEAMISRLFSEVDLLSSLKNEHIITFYHSWTDNKSLNFITEVCVSGSLRDYRKKHRHLSIIAVKKWCRQILKGLEYLHLHEPCVIHRDLNCSNIFINGNTGQIKIGDLGLATMVGESHRAHSLLGTPEFMAPELYEENYTEKVDIYSFGMCLLEMVTLEIPYSECDTVAKVYKRVTCGIRPMSLNKVRDPQVKGFIDKCLCSDRPSASELLRDPFFQGIDDLEFYNMLHPKTSVHKL